VKVYWWNELLVADWVIMTGGNELAVMNWW